MNQLNLSDRSMISNSLSPLTSRNVTINKLIKQYDKTGKPSVINFRKIVSKLPYSGRPTHLIHPYPAKLLSHIPNFFLENTIFSQPGDTVLDPFCGSGTVLLESLLAGRHAIGIDSNPLARLISRVKTRPLSTQNLNKASSRLLNRISRCSTTQPPDVVNLNYWFHKHVTKQLTCILKAIRATRNPFMKDLFLISFSNCVRRVSLADPRLSVPVRLRKDQYPEEHQLYDKTIKRLRRLRRINVIKEFTKILKDNCDKVGSLQKIITSDVMTQIVGSDARNLKYEFEGNGYRGQQIPDESISLVITSPPYGGAQKYIRASSLNLGWLEMCSVPELQSYKRATIGREDYRKSEYIEPVAIGIPAADKILGRLRDINPLRAHIAGNYLLEMREAFTEVVRVLKKRGYLILVAGNSHVCGYKFRTNEYLRAMLQDLGLTVKLELIDHIRSRGLMTKRNKTANIITREWVMVFQKEEFNSVGL